MPLDLQLIEPATFAHEEAAMGLRTRAPITLVSGLANDYLNLFSELVLMLEKLPQMPELVGELLAWRPMSYKEYFSRSKLSGSHSALEAYDQLNPAFRRRFETFAAELDIIALAAVASVRRLFKDGSPNDFDRLSEICHRAGEKMRIVLVRASRLVNHANLGEFVALEEKSRGLISPGKMVAFK
jgi:hypothetical protein